MPSANLGMRVRTETRVGIGNEVGTEVGTRVEINVGIETGEKKGRAEKDLQQKMENRSCMINLTSGSLAISQP